MAFNYWKKLIVYFFLKNFQPSKIDKKFKKFLNELDFILFYDAFPSLIHFNFFKHKCVEWLAYLVASVWEARATCEWSRTFLSHVGECLRHRHKNLPSSHMREDCKLFPKLGLRSPRISWISSREVSAIRVITKKPFFSKSF